MKTTRIDIEGRQGRATIFRSGDEIIINLTRLAGRPDTTIRRGTGRNDSWTVPATDRYDAHKQIAIQLQYQLDGYAGTNSDIHDYLRVLQTFAD